MDVAAHFRIYDFSQLADNETLLLHWIQYFRLRPSIADRLDVQLPSYFAAMLNKLSMVPIVWVDPKSHQFDTITAEQLRFDWMRDPEPVPDAAGYVEQTRHQEANMAAAILAAFGG